jgi:3D-(3,5/4)-trihydroxycyclohexane-1,2-dione acylhydrolase (decyclizing)
LSHTDRTVRLTVGQAIVRYLSAQFSERDGQRRRLVPAMLGIFGHGNVCGLGEALDEESELLPYLQGKNEQGMVHTAIGYAKSQHNLATLACTASIGPGATNMLTGAATATVNRIPVLLFPSDTFANRLQGPPMQALEIPLGGDVTVNDCFRPVSRLFDRITRPEQLLTAMPRAMRALLAPEAAGAVTISLHQDVQAEAYDFPTWFFAEHTWHVARRAPDHEEIARAAEALRNAQRPLLIAGGGVRASEAQRALCELSIEHRIPVAETSAGKGVGARSPLNVGAIGHSGTRAANALAREADVIVCVGTRLIDLTTGSNSLFNDPGVRFVGINVDGFDADKLGALPVVADARAGLEALSGVLSSTGWAAPESWRARRDTEVTEWRRAVDESLHEEPGQMLTQGQAIRVLNRQAQPEDVLIVASGTPHVDIHKLWESERCENVLMEVGFSCMGHEIPAGVGVRFGAGEDTGEVYVMIGDGTYIMGHSELVTAVQEQLKITVIVVENHGFQSIHALQRARTGRSFGLEFRRRRADGLAGPYIPVDLAANAASYGCATYVAESADELADVLTKARTEAGPTVIVVRVDPHRLTLASDCWWDVGVAAVSRFPETQAAYAESERGRADQRWHG